MRPESPKDLEDIRDAATGYESIDHEIVWHLIQADLPRLLELVEGLLAEAADP